MHEIIYQADTSTCTNTIPTINGIPTTEVKNRLSGIQGLMYTVNSILYFLHGGLVNPASAKSLLRVGAPARSCPLSPSRPAG